MGDDIRRYLAGEPLEAGPDSASYRFKKTLRKHKGPFIAVAIVFLVLVGGIIGISFYAVEAERQRVIAISAAESEAEQRLVAVKALEEAKSSKLVAEQERASALQQAYYGNIHAAFSAINQDATASARRRLDAARDAVTVLELDDLPFEWKYLDAKNDDSLAVLKGHEMGVTSVAFSPDGSRIVSGGDSSVRVWNTKSRGHIAHERRLAQNRVADLSPIVTAWFEKANGESELVLSMLDREVKNRPLEEANTLRNLVLKKLVEQRQAKQMQDTE